MTKRIITIIAAVIVTPVEILLLGNKADFCVTCGDYEECKCDSEMQ